MMRRKFLLLGILIFNLVLSFGQQPNIVLVMMDDVGYGDLGSLGSPIIETPNLDKLYDECVRFTNYHSGTTCSPTRASLLTGRHYDKLGVWHTILGRSLLSGDVVTLPEILGQYGYRTGIFGKWHLGDNEPMRPQDQGFGYTLIHGGGGVGQTPDFWGNDYFDDTYFRNGKAEKFEGYCTDIWMNEAMLFMERSKMENKPFFCYIPLNAAHSPYNAPEDLVQKYLDLEGAINPPYNAMVDNIDLNMGRLMQKLQELDIDKETILIFTSDNGTSRNAGVQIDKEGFVTNGFNGGMRGVKGQTYEGGHRVPFFLRCPDLGFDSGTDISHLSSCMDIVPTLLSLCNISHEMSFDGEDLSPYLRGAPAGANKIHIADTQRSKFLVKDKNYVVMKDQWRLVNGELYDLRADPEQRTDLKMEYPDTVAFLKAAYESWWSEVEVANEAKPEVRIPIPGDQVTEINCMDMFPDDESHTAWNQEMILQEKNATSGIWKLEVQRKGRYRVTVRMMPWEAGDIKESFFQGAGQSSLRVNDDEPQRINNLEQKVAIYEVDLLEGPLDLRAAFVDAEGNEVAAQFAMLEPMTR